MTDQFDDALQQILNLLQDGRIHDKRQLWRDLGRRGIDVSYMTLDMALDLLRRADLMRIVNVTTVQITDYGSRLLRDGLVITRESLQVPPKPSPSSTHDVKEVLPTRAHDQTSHPHHEQHQRTINALLADILREFGKPLHFTKIFELALKKGMFRQLPNAKNVSTDTVFQALNNNSYFRSTGKGVFSLTEWYDLQPVGRTSSHDNGKSSRVALFAQILTEVGKPLHCREIHGEALKRLPTKDHFPMNLAYISLYGSSRFHLLGDGVFALAEWAEDQKAKPTVSNEKPSRAALFAQILTDAGKPLHYRDIHQKALESLPAEEHFPANLAYISLHTSSRFQLLGDGVFALAEWDEDQKVNPVRADEKPSRAALFARILADAGKPLHYRDIHQKALESLPVEEHFPANLAYVSLYSSNRFQALGDGVFALAEWDEHQKVSPVRPDEKPSRAALFAQILADASRPLHYRDIHQKALECLPVEEHFSDQLAYISLHGSSRFRLLGDGIYGLAEWEHVDRPYFEENGTRVFMICPRPLLPEAHHSRSLFESVVTGVRIAQYYPSLTAKQFLRHMTAWAQNRALTQEAIRNAFDTWYVVGLLDQNDYHYNTNTSITIAIDYDASLVQVRNHCLNSLCQRLEHTTTILHLIHILPPMSPTAIQQFLRDQEGYRLHVDIVDYLEFLAAFEAVQRNGDGWQLTPIGEAILQANPPQRLPDFSNFEEVAHEANNGDDLTWEDELGLLDL